MAQAKHNIPHQFRSFVEDMQALAKADRGSAALVPGQYVVVDALDRLAWWCPQMGQRRAIFAAFNGAARPICMASDAISSLIGDFVLHASSDPEKLEHIRNQGPLDTRIELLSALFIKRAEGTEQMLTTLLARWEVAA